MNEDKIILIDYPEYSIDKNGNIFSHYFKNRFGTYVRKTPYKLKNELGLNGYYSVYLGSQLKKQAKRLLVHRLLAITFIPNPENKPWVNHIDGNKKNNSLDNLEWCTQSENELHAHRTGLKNFKFGNAPYKKLSSKMVMQIRALGKVKTQAEIALTYNVSQSNISKILNNVSW